MRDIPVFTTQNGVASLTLKQIPYWGSAYIRIQDADSPEQLLQECVDFCRCVGADAIYATGHSNLEQYPLHSRVVCMRCQRESIGDTEASLMPVLPETLEQWRQIYNERMRAVPNAAYMTVVDAEEMLSKGNGYFIHKGDSLLGIGIAGGEQIDCVISTQKGAGADIVKALCHALFCETINLEVAMENTRAVRLYESLGFIITREISAWYKIL